MKTSTLILSALVALPFVPVQATDTEAREDALSRGIVILPGNDSVRISLDRANATYACGEEAAFSVTILGADKSPLKEGLVRWRLDNYGEQVFASGRQDLAKGNPFTVRGTLPYPGFLRLGVTPSGKKQRPVRYSAAFDPEKIRTAIPKPADFDSFWDNAVAKLEKEVPLDAKVEQAPGWPKDGVNVERVSFATSNGRRVHGLLATPVEKGIYPVKICFPGAGPGLVLDRFRADAKHITLFMNAHYYPVPDNEAAVKIVYDAQEADWRRIHGKNSARAYPVGGLTLSPEEAHYYGIILGVNRAINWVAARPDVDHRHFFYTGASQGGGFGLILTALNKNITRAYAGVPAMTDVMGCKANRRQSGWPRILEYETQKDPARLAKIEANAPYFDAAYFAERITVPIRLSVGYIDESCAPHAVLSAYNAIPSKDKKLYHGVGGHHGSRNAPMGEIGRWLEQ